MSSRCVGVRGIWICELENSNCQRPQKAGHFSVLFLTFSLNFSLNFCVTHCHYVYSACKSMSRYEEKLSQETCFSWDFNPMQKHHCTGWDTVRISALTLNKYISVPHAVENKLNLSSTYLRVSKTKVSVNSWFLFHPAPCFFKPKSLFLSKPTHYVGFFLLIPCHNSSNSKRNQSNSTEISGMVEDNY